MIIEVVKRIYKWWKQLQEMMAAVPKKNGFLMIGDKDSGKTTYMCCAYGMLKSTSKDGFSIMAKNEMDDVMFSKLHQEIKQGRYPLPTEKRSQYDFNITYHGEILHDFTWTDYNGGMIFHQSNPDREQFGRDIMGTSGLMLFFDSHRLLNHDLDLGMRRIIKMISQSLPSIESDYFVNIVLTKYDLLTPLQQQNYNILLDELSPILDVIDGNSFIHLNVVPVCCTSEKIVNCDDSLMLMMIGPLKYFFSQQRNQIENKLQEMRDWQSEAGFFNEVASFFKGEKSASKKAKECKKMAEEMQIRLDGLVSKVADLQNKLQVKNYVGMFNKSSNYG